jgi:hypothetical protein
MGNVVRVVVDLQVAVALGQTKSAGPDQGRGARWQLGGDVVDD